MKKIILLFIVVSSVSITSCRKDRTCSCTETTTAGNNSTVTTTEELVGHVTKRAAKKEAGCYSGKSTVTSNGSAYQVTTDCKLK